MIIIIVVREERKRERKREGDFCGDSFTRAHSANLCIQQTNSNSPCGVICTLAVSYCHPTERKFTVWWSCKLFMVRLLMCPPNIAPHASLFLHLTSTCQLTNQITHILRIKCTNCTTYYCFPSHVSIQNNYHFKLFYMNKNK